MPLLCSSIRQRPAGSMSVLPLKLQQTCLLQPGQDAHITSARCTETQCLPVDKARQCASLLQHACRAPLQCLETTEQHHQTQQIYCQQSVLALLLRACIQRIWQGCIWVVQVCVSYCTLRSLPKESDRGLHDLGKVSVNVCQTGMQRIAHELRSG